MIQDIFEETKIDYAKLLELINNFIDSCDDKSEKTKYTYSRALLEFSNFFNNDGSFFFLIKDVRRYKNFLLKKKSMAIYSVRTYQTALRQFCNFLIQNEIIKKNPVKRVPLKIENKETKIIFLDNKDVELLLQGFDRSNINGFRDYLIFLFSIDYGLTGEEISHIMLSSIFKDKRTWKLIIKKNDKIETITLNKRCVLAIQEYLDKRKIQIGMNTPLFVSYSNRTKEKQLTARGIREIIKSGLKLFNSINNKSTQLIRPYILRHTSIINMIKLGKSQKEIIQRFDIKLKSTIKKYFELTKIN